MDGGTEIRYAGVVVGRATELRDRREGGAFIVVPDPLPVGTRMRLTGDGTDEPVEVIAVVESADVAQSGMQVRFTSKRAALPEQADGSGSVVLEPPARNLPAASPAPSARPPEPTQPTLFSVPVVAAPASEPEAIPTAVAPAGSAGNGSEAHSVQSGGGRRRRRRR